MKLHCCVAAYISDYSFLGTAALPHLNLRMAFMASLDHSMWFHAPFRADDWMLYECESHWAGKGNVICNKERRKCLLITRALIFKGGGVGFGLNFTPVNRLGNCLKKCLSLCFQNQPQYKLVN